MKNETLSAYNFLIRQLRNKDAQDLFGKGILIGDIDDLVEFIEKFNYINKIIDSKDEHDLRSFIQGSDI